MKSSLFVVLLALAFNMLSAQNLKPYILAIETTETIEEVKAKVETQLLLNGFEIAGQYQPAEDKNRWIMIIRSSELRAAVQKVGGLTGFAATLRIGFTSENGKTFVSYTNPNYWGNAYFQKEFDKVASNYSKFNEQLEKAFKAAGNFVGTGFGSAKGLTKEDLQEYHYMMGMPYFDDTVELEEFASYQGAVAKIDAAVKAGKPNLKLIYKIEIPGKELTLYGFALSGPKGESKFLPIVDLGSPKHTAFLPYEILVSGKDVHMLHGRYRIALSFPDLTMGTFSKIMSTPGDIEDLLKQLVE
ncbi:MAG: hypothetical protein FD155_1069 [Bacteroidetes bacterium]|nr:MAG: hypothetical protein FD155_1069 [Bacteroidota bacterium]